MKNNNLEKGVAIYLVVIIVSTLTAVSLNVASIIIGGSKMTSNAGDSVKAFYAADTGIEHALYNAKSSTCSTVNSAVGSDTKYTYIVTVSNPDNCEVTTSMISIGEYKPDTLTKVTQRRISISY
ncbi:MAG: hypothetical protein PHD93_02450 [Candidatus Pacebacteria bacterium]|nr:hypothetical protein [Candidatus Paceibacterota bacterium]